MPTTRKPNRSVALWILAAALLLVGGGAAAHELDHQFHKHEVPCALHFYAGHLDGVASTPIALASATPASDKPGAAVSGTAARTVVLPYAVRAPPSS